MAFNILKYESDEGLFYKQSKILSGMSFSNMAFYRSKRISYDLQKDLERTNSSIIGSIEIVINQSNFDNYQRTYQRLQSLLAEIMSVINLLLEIGRQISKFLCNKKMSCDIIDALLNIKNDPRLSQQNNNNINNLITKKLKKSERIKIIPKINQEKIIRSSENNQESKLNKSKESNELICIRKINKKDINNNIIENINYFHIIKSFLCFKDERTKLINDCSRIINEDLCVGKILYRFYNLENICNYFSSKEVIEINIAKDKRFYEINQHIININNEIKREDSSKEAKTKT